MSDTGGNDEQAEFWEERASSWIGSEPWLALVTGPFGRIALDRLALRHGDRVLDVGCGTGPTTVDIARRVAPGGAVLGIDISPTMLDAARGRADTAGVEAVTFRVADAQVDDLGAGAHDAAFSQFGVMFFADPVAAFANLRRSLREGGRLAFCCWQPVLANEWMLVPGAAAISVTGVLPPMPEPGRPGPFSLSEDGVAAGILEAAGFGDVEVVAHEAQIVVDEARLPEVVESAAQMGALREAMASIDDPAVHAQLRTAVRAALEERVERGRLRLGAAAYIVSATA